MRTIKKFVLKRLLPVFALLVAATITFSASASAAPKKDTPKPGWGHGDKNHTHTGPPGHSVRPGHTGVSVRTDNTIVVTGNALSSIWISFTQNINTTVNNFFGKI